MVNPREVDSNLAVIESSPPPPLPQPSFRERMASRFERLRVSPQALVLGALLIVAIVALAWFAISQLGDLDESNFEFGVALGHVYG